MDDVYFQQDGATCHTISETIGLLCEKFPGQMISRKGDYNWPPRSCDLTSLDFFLWGYVKDKVYVDAPQSMSMVLFFITLEIPYNKKLEHRRPLCIEREKDPLHILLVATRCHAHYMMRAVSLSVMPCE